MYLSGDIQFANNTGEEETALEMLSFAQVVLMKGLHVNFEGNTGRLVTLAVASTRIMWIALPFSRYGASVRIDTLTTSAVYHQLLSNPHCPFLYEDSRAVPEEWSDVRH